ncbi:MAG TPA: BON domain-containing protein [Hanamia sp.]
MDNNNRSNRYQDDNRSSSNENNDRMNWDRNYTPGSNERNEKNEKPNVSSSDRERDYWNAKNFRINNRMDDRYWNRDSYNYADYDRHERDYRSFQTQNNNEDNRNRGGDNSYGNNFNSDYNRNYNNDNNRNSNDRVNNYGNDYDRLRNSGNGSNNYDDNSRNNPNEGWRNNSRENDRNWWNKTRDEVASWFGDDDAERRRHRDDRRNGMHRGKGPKNYTRSEDRIREDVSDQLSDDSYLDASNIEVEVKGSEVTLKGTVDSRYSKHRAEDLTEDITGVTHVQNNLRVVNETTPQESVANQNANTFKKTNEYLNSTENYQKNKKESSLS